MGYAEEENRARVNVCLLKYPAIEQCRTAEQLKTASFTSPRAMAWARRSKTVSRLPLLPGGAYWTRTSDLRGVNTAL